MLVCCYLFNSHCTFPALLKLHFYNSPPSQPSLWCVNAYKKQPIQNSLHLHGSVHKSRTVTLAFSLSLSLTGGLTGRTLANTSFQRGRGEKTVILGGRDGTKLSLRCVVWGKENFSPIFWACLFGFYTILFNKKKHVKLANCRTDLVLKTKPKWWQFNICSAYFSSVVSTVFFFLLRILLVLRCFYFFILAHVPNFNLFSCFFLLDVTFFTLFLCSKKKMMDGNKRTRGK